MNITNSDITAYINGFYKPENSCLSELRKMAEEDRVPIILKETESFLRFMTEAFKPERILEIGTAVGYSALFFARSGAEVVTVEKSEAMAETAKNNIKEAGLESKITVLTGDGEEVLKELLSCAENAEAESDGGERSESCRGLFDMVFIDAAKSHYRRFLEAALPLCRDGALIISDNVLLKGATASDKYDPNGRFKTNIKNMRSYLKYIAERPDLKTSVIACGDGLALSVVQR